MNEQYYGSIWDVLLSVLVTWPCSGCVVWVQWLHDSTDHPQQVGTESLIRSTQSAWQRGRGLSASYFSLHEAWSTSHLVGQLDVSKLYVFKLLQRIRSQRTSSQSQEKPKTSLQHIATLGHVRPVMACHPTKAKYEFQRQSRHNIQGTKSTSSLELRHVKCWTVLKSEFYGQKGTIGTWRNISTSASWSKVILPTDPKVWTTWWP